MSDRQALPQPAADALPPAVLALLQRRFLALAIGASAGGVEALGRLLPALPAGLPLAVFVVLHQARERPSRLAELFAPRCALAVPEAVDKLPVEAGTLYFAPPDYHLLVEAADADADTGPALALSADEPVNWSRPSIDVLFESAAACYGPALLGVLLTGASHDGAAGLAAIHHAGGATVVQDPTDALAPAMPAAALERFTPDLVLPLAGITLLMARLSESPR